MLCAFIKTKVLRVALFVWSTRQQCYFLFVLIQVIFKETRSVAKVRCEQMPATLPCLSSIDRERATVGVTSQHGRLPTAQPYCLFSKWKPRQGKSNLIITYKKVLIRTIRRQCRCITWLNQWTNIMIHYYFSFVLNLTKPYNGKHHEVNNVLIHILYLRQKL